MGDYLEVKGSGLVRQIQLVTFDSTGAPLLVLAPAAPSQVGMATAQPNILAVANANQLAVGMIVQTPGPPIASAQISAINNTSFPPTITLSQPLPAGPLTFLPPPPPGTPPGPGAVYASPTQEYRIIRQPRVLTGETPLQLPAGICIDPGRKYNSDPFLLTQQDILFSPQGGVLNSGGRDAIILWVRDYTKDVSYPVADAALPSLNWPPPGQPGDQFLILIQTHTGFIAQHPVNVSPGNVTPQNGADPYLPYRFAMDARSSGL
jgi:hypothetical protein